MNSPKAARAGAANAATGHANTGDATLDRVAHATLPDRVAHATIPDRAAHATLPDRVAHATVPDRVAHASLSDRVAHAVILDRDGVVNFDSDDYIKRPEEWHPIPGSLEAIARLNAAAYRIGVASNQSGVGRGLFSVETLDAIHAKMHAALAAAGAHIDALAYCPHTPDDACACRKPKPGLLARIGADLGIDVRGVPFVGDSLADIEAARALGALPVLVRTGKGQRTLADARCPPDVPVFDDLAAFADALLTGRLQRPPGHDGSP
jgi:D-glycero-D-manno-heptose 1,7-bisphosphate phosphatase